MQTAAHSSFTSPHRSIFNSNSLELMGNIVLPAKLALKGGKPLNSSSKPSKNDNAPLTLVSPQSSNNKLSNRLRKKLISQPGLEVETNKQFFYYSVIT